MRDKKLLVSDIALIIGILPLFIRLMLFIVIKIRMSRMRAPIVLCSYRDHKYGLTGVITGISSFVFFILTALGYIDRAFGFMSGTAGIAMAGFLLKLLHSGYKQQRPGLPSSFSIEQK